MDIGNILKEEQLVNYGNFVISIVFKKGILARLHIKFWQHCKTFRLERNFDMYSTSNRATFAKFVIKDGAKISSLSYTKYHNYIL